ncbi:hypothetical protein ACEN2I_02590 [Flavobacterium sp. W22_SRS_FK3]|uniref:hypothetical protein n=1 Tax=Flavobacterium sp. W22_SRS_FK3 TaxID=3240275 RepID=UPI003F92881D
MDITTQIIWLFILAIPIACVSWTVTQEEIFREPRQWCVNRSQNDKKFLTRKFFYLFTCEYCFSHYITLLFISLCDFKLLLIEDWRGYLIAGFSLVFLANAYMSLFALLRQAIKKEKVEIKKIETDADLK